MGWNHRLDWIFTISTGDRRISEPWIVSRGASSKVTLGERWANFNFEGSWLNCPKLFQKTKGNVGTIFTPNPWGSDSQFFDEHIFQMGWWKKPPSSHFLCRVFLFPGRVNLPRNQGELSGGCWEFQSGQKGGVWSARWKQRWPSIENLHCRRGLGGGGFKYFSICTPTWGRFPFWLISISLKFWWNHQLEEF